MVYIIVFGFSALMFLAIGIAIGKFKMYDLIAGYNTMSKEDRQKVDTVSLGRLMTRFAMFNFLVSIICAILPLVLENTLPLFIIWMTALLSSTAYTLVVAQKYNVKNSESNNKAVTTLVVSIVSVVSIGIIVLVLASGRPTTYSLKDSSLEISGSYGGDVLYSDIEEIEIRNTIPDDLFRSNGMSAGGVKKGNYMIGADRYKIFADESLTKFIYFNVDDTTYILSSESDQLTLELFESLKTKTE